MGIWEIKDKLITWLIRTLWFFTASNQRKKDRKTDRQAGREKETDRDIETDKKLFPCLSILQMWDITKYDSKILGGCISTGDAYEWFKSWEWDSR